MFKVIKKMEFCYGHRLVGHPGLCKHLHGHNARVELEFESATLNAQGMVCDFLEIKSKIKTWIDQTLDHKMILHQSDPLVAVLRQKDEPIVIFDKPPTAEVFAQKIFDYAKSLGFPIVAVRLWETETSMASFTGGE